MGIRSRVMPTHVSPRANGRVRRGVKKIARVRQILMAREHATLSAWTQTGSASKAQAGRILPRRGAETRLSQNFANGRDGRIPPCPKLSGRRRESRDAVERVPTRAASRPAPKIRQP